MTKITVPKSIEGVERVIREVLTENESECLLSLLDIRKRNRRIRRQYPALKDEYGSETAWRKLAEQEHTTIKNVKKILYSKRVIMPSN